MKKFISLFIVSSLFFSFSLKADEGMWLPILLEKYNIGTMTKMGLKLSAEDIYSINHSSIKDAILALDHGSCTAEVVSPDGLLLTNHHCGYGEIQAHSSTEHDYLTDGFWARSREEELANPGKTASFLIRVEDVTERIISQLNDTMPEARREAVVDSIAKVIEKAATDSTFYNAKVNGMFKGNYYYLFVYETFKDIRLVGAPPESIGKFGSDTDNWMWPRHTGDFSMFRIYCSPDGKPAEYSEENVPFHPKHHLPISLKGVKNGDFAMILGYPGSTQRFLTSWGVKETIEQENPNRIKIRGKKQSIWKEDMSTSDKIRIQYSSKYARSSNYWKYSIGENKGLKRLKVYEQKQKLEARFTDWVNLDPQRKEKYGEALNLIEEAYKNSEKYNNAVQYLYETMIGGTEVVRFAMKGGQLNHLLNNSPDSTNLINAGVEKLKAQAKDFFKDYSVTTDKKVFVALINMYYQDVPKEFHPDFYNLINKKFKGSVEKFADYLYKKSIFVDQNRLNAFLSKPNKKVIAKDPAYIMMKSVINKYREIYAASKEFNSQLYKGERLFEAGLLEMDKNKAFYPDANSTMRLTYGKVGDYYPKDAVHYDYYTTLKGVMEKEDPNNHEFVVKQKLKDLYNAKDYGQYGDADGTLHLCFITDNDITGGNSGSPVINGEGQLIGIAFDSNWEGMSSDVAFDKEYVKCVNVDIRYVLFVIDKFAGATNLIDEMTIVTEETPAVEENAEQVQEPATVE
ncbi:MAG: serine protease [Bacteroidetes bacterium]|nr:MAG: serine protease [Bacteroidota bacterium]